MLLEGSKAERFTEPRSSQQPDRATRISLPVQATGGPNELGPFGTSDQAPASACTVVVVVVAVVTGVVVDVVDVDEGRVVVDAAGLPEEPPQPAIASTHVNDAMRRNPATMTSFP